MKKIIKFSQAAKNLNKKKDEPKGFDPKTAPVHITIIQTGNIHVVLGKDSPQGKYGTSIIAFPTERNT